MGIADHPSGLRVRAERNIFRQTPRQVLRYMPNGKINSLEGDGFTSILIFGASSGAFRNNKRNHPSLWSTWSAGRQSPKMITC